MSRWQLRMTANGSFYRPYTRQVVEFASLETPVTEAILGMNRTGCYALAIADSVNEYAENDWSTNCILLKAYGLPSPDVLDPIVSEQERVVRTRHRPVSPLLWSLSLPLDGVGSLERTLCAKLPIDIILSSDDQIGLASVSVDSETDDGYLHYRNNFLFVLPGMQQTGVDTLGPFVWKRVRSNNHTCSCQKEFLWRTEWMPELSNGPMSVFYRCPGYVTVSQTCDQLRISWLRHSVWWPRDPCNTYLGASCDHFIMGEMKPWISILCDSEWKAIGNADDRLCFCLEQEVSLKDILRQVHGDERPYCRDVIGLRMGGRVLDLLLSFGGRCSEPLVTVIVAIDLFTGDYEELQKNEYFGEGKAKEKLHDIETNKWRMRQFGLGPYCLGSQKEIDWSRLQVIWSDLTELEGQSDYDQDAWLEVLRTTETLTYNESSSLVASNVRKIISKNSLFPTTYQLNNRAVIAASPVFTMEAKAGPVKLVYIDDETANFL